MIKVVDRLMKAVEVFVTSMLALMVCLVFIQIIWRYVLRSPLSWTDQTCRFILVWSIMLGIPVMFHKHNAVAFDAIFAKTKGGARKTLELLICILGAFFAATFFACAVDFVKKSGSLAVPGFPWMKYSMLYVSEVVGAALLFVVMIKQIVERIRNKEIEEVDG